MVALGGWVGYMQILIHDHDTAHHNPTHQHNTQQYTAAYHGLADALSLGSPALLPRLQRLRLRHAFLGTDAVSEALGRALVVAGRGASLEELVVDVDYALHVRLWFVCWVYGG